MEDKKLSNEQSLELITQMVQRSRRQIEVRSGNQYLWWGWFSFVLACVIGILLHTTQCSVWNIAWFAYFPFWGVMVWMSRHHHSEVVTYTDRVMSDVWQVVGWAMVLSAVVLAVVSFTLATSRVWVFMLPLSILLSGIGSSVTALILREKTAAWIPVAGMALAVYLFPALAFGVVDGVWASILFGVAQIAVLIVPGYIVNQKAQ